MIKYTDIPSDAKWYAKIGDRKAKCDGCGKWWQPGEKFAMAALPKVGDDFPRKPGCSACCELPPTIRRQLEALTAPDGGAGNASEAIGWQGARRGIAEQPALQAACKDAGISFAALLSAFDRLAITDSLKSVHAGWSEAFHLACTLGVIPGTGPTATAYLIPRGGIIRLELSYKGLCDLVHKAGAAYIHAEPVWEAESRLGTLVSEYHECPTEERALALRRLLDRAERIREHLTSSPTTEQGRRLLDAFLIDDLSGRPWYEYRWFRYVESPDGDAAPVLIADYPQPPIWSKPRADNDAREPRYPVGFYARGKMKGGAVGSVFLPFSEVIARGIRGRNIRATPETDPRAFVTAGRSETPYDTDLDQMGRKAALRDLLTHGRLPVAGLASALAAYETELDLKIGMDIPVVSSLVGAAHRATERYRTQLADPDALIEGDTADERAFDLVTRDGGTP